MEKQSVLGRGVGALLSEELPQEGEERFFLCDIDKIKPNPNQPRKNFDQKQLQNLADSIKEKGVIQPLLVTKGKGNRYFLIAGERRLRASRIAGQVEVPVVIMDEGGARESLELALIENVVRHDLNPIEEATAYARLLDEFELTQEDVARKVGKKRSTVSNTLRLLTLPSSIQEDVVQSVLSEGHARVLLRLKDEPKMMMEIRDRVIKEKLSVRETERACKQQKKTATAPNQLKKKKKNSDVLPDSYCKSITNMLTNHLNTKIQIAQNGSRGKIEIEYYSSDDLDRLITLLTEKE